ncbi:UDP-N-acetylmuramoylalanyl-D-glutamate--2,6-diaminopimelate ligase [bacterium A37T11]|nr:UDP-N-acetylmuramoylalanyl-D-glutamate--2,6-diaminopimelate ligase [bacterium A37T11]
MKALTDILWDVQTLRIIGDPEMAIMSLCFDSRKIRIGDLFFAIRGTASDGHQYIQNAVIGGAAAIICEELPENIVAGITYVHVADASLTLGEAAANFYGRPSDHLSLVGVTGTNGKTTVATLLFKLFSGLGNRCGLLSTVQNQVVDQVIPATHTTADPIALNKLLQEMVDAGCDYCFMEVSSHAIVQQRIAGLRFVGGIFTNLTHDHLDFHKTFGEYLKAKKLFFDQLPDTAFALTNLDDKNGMVMLQNTSAFKKTYALKSLADFKAKIKESHFEGMLMEIDAQEVWVRLVGNFNAYNILAVYGTAVLLEQDSAKVLTVLSRLSGAEGRFETQISSEGIVGIVDYAHTPDAVLNVLETIHKLRKGTEQVITVLGCGGDRDKTKRPEMAQVALSLSDKVIITSDNPRSEDPAQIIRDMEAGIPAGKAKKVFSITDRREAIRAACHLAQAGDIILVAGKGHEKYQEIKGVKYPFDDKEVLAQAFKE